MGFDWVSVRNIKIHDQILTCCWQDVHAGVAMTTCWKVFKALISGLSDGMKEIEQERMSCCKIHCIFSSSRSHTLQSKHLFWHLTTTEKIHDVKRPGKTVIYFECMSKRVREGEKEAVEEFILGQYGNSIEINHKPAMILLSSQSCIYNSEISQNKNSFFWSSFDKDLTWTE